MLEMRDHKYTSIYASSITNEKLDDIKIIFKIVDVYIRHQYSLMVMLM